MAWPWINALPLLSRNLMATPYLEGWHAMIAKRPAVQRGIAIPRLDADAA